MSSGGSRRYQQKSKNIIMSENFDIFVIGAGVAGLTAAEEAVRKNLKVGLAEEQMFGGLVVNVNHLQPAPSGLPETGGDLAADMMMRVADLGVTTLMEPVTSLDRGANGAIAVKTAEGSYSARCVILASGARLRKLGIPGETEFEHRGVAHCADCDAPLYRDQSVVVVGGGDSALQEALVLAEYCSAVHLVHRGASFSARADFAKAVQGNSRIIVHFDTIVEGIEGSDAVTGVRLRNATSGATETLPCKGFFAYVGLEPNADFLSDLVERDSGFVKVNTQLESSLQNLFAIGAVRAGYAGQLTDAMADAKAAVAAASNRLATPA